MKRLLSLLLGLGTVFVFLAAKPLPKNYLGWAVHVAQSDMKRNPELWMVDFNRVPKWDYCQGLMSSALLKLYNQTYDTLFYNYVKRFADLMIDSTGVIRSYKITDFSLDRVNGGKFLITLYQRTHDPKYLKAIKTLHSQLLCQPRTLDGGFWHKAIYPHQMWLDGSYMASPFLAQYGSVFLDITATSDAIHQLLVMAKHTYDPKTGLYYHAWDESHQQLWANKTTGQSPNFWSRSMGWYMMALVDVLDYVPANNPNRKDLIAIFQNLSKTLLKYQDPQTGLWYQVTDSIGTKGNYLESSSTAMFMYAITKGVNKGYLSRHYLSISRTTFDRFIHSAVVIDANGSYNITKACAVAGLGGHPYRDGSYSYYIHTPQRNNDPKVIGPFMMWCCELSKANQ
ncbi:glycoside hydrolase family 88/105 protein [Microbacter margulisiae]|uniref:Unsaturated rhamnogalacturonyl hydrolase n=1 Tax=Microbacter margulisiae TaxID=1350067 RepID=A0A7W5DRY4_9PORP|nr:glycoside hydrolase family 88 protein [Microbacter margulisiae]MBB3187976.1 unsaturated rhamnogalacturonyl hydrolase [Microbacter margulisiae]